MKKQKQKVCNKSKRSKKGQPTEKLSSWVDELDWIAVEDASKEKNDPSNSVSIVSWNVLADAYCSPRSHQQLPLKFQRHVFDRNQRQHHVRQSLRRMAVSLAPDMFALQEVDPPLEVGACMKELGYEGVETPSNPGGKDGRVDACALYYCRDQWKCLDHQIVRLDDLATLRSNSTNTNTPDAARSNLQGVQTSFIRKNMALLVRLEHLQSKRQLVVAVLHLYWNPAYEYVKVRSVAV
jgi:mRNA deadenylase 3'-5' endonuclease subunit Ccr4